MNTDICSAPVSLQHAETLSHWNKMVRAFLAHGATTPQHLGTVLEAEPDFALGHAVRGLFCLMAGRSEMWQVAEDAQQPMLRVTLAQSPNARRDGSTRWIVGWPTVQQARLPLWKGCCATPPKTR